MTYEPPLHRTELSPPLPSRLCRCFLALRPLDKPEDVDQFKKRKAEDPLQASAGAVEQKRESEEEEEEEERVEEEDGEWRLISLSVSLSLSLSLLGSVQGSEDTAKQAGM